MARAKCRRGSIKKVKLPLLSAAASNQLRQAKSKGARRLLGKVVEVVSCTGKKGQHVVKSVRIKKGSPSGSVAPRGGRPAVVSASHRSLWPMHMPPPPPPRRYEEAIDQ